MVKEVAGLASAVLAAWILIATLNPEPKPLCVKIADALVLSGCSSDRSASGTPAAYVMLNGAAIPEPGSISQIMKMTYNPDYEWVQRH